MYLMTKRLLMLFLSILLPVFLLACGSDESQTTSTQVVNGYSAVLSNVSTVRTWGANGYGQLGNDNISDNHNPVKMAKFSNTLTEIATGGGHVLALDSTNGGSVWAWGYNAYGQVGNVNVSSNSRIPVKVLFTPVLGVTAIAAGSQHSLALDGNGTVWAWGYNFYGQLGNNQNTDNSSVPAQVKRLDGVILDKIVAIAAGGDFSLALDSDGFVWAWGNNEKGQLGIPLALPPTTTKTSLGAVKVIGLQITPKISNIAAGAEHGLALDSDGDVWGWGYNSFGQLGQTVTTDSSFFSAVKITALTVKATKISAGSAHSLALGIDGSVYAWGYNFYGQLGNGDTLKKENSVPTPQKVGVFPSDTVINSINAFGLHNIAIDSKDNVWTWGYNGYGQLGDGTTTDRSLAQQVFFP